MRNLRLTVCLLLLSFIFSSCKEDTPTSNLRITGVFPSSNPIGGPVKIAGIGFGDQVKIFFDGVPAIIEQRSDTFLTTKVPQGINGSGISISVESGEGADELADVFDVLNSFPSNLPTSPPNIFIPSLTVNSTLPFSISGADYVWHKNVYDSDHEIGLMFRRQEGFDHFRSWETLTLDSILYRSNILTDGQELFKYDTATNVIELSTVDIDRAGATPSPHPYISEVYDAQYFRIENFSFPAQFLASMDNICLTNNFLLLESKTTGRQYVFVVYDKKYFNC